MSSTWANSPILRLQLLVKQVMAIRKETILSGIACLITAEPHSSIMVDDHFGALTLVKITNNCFIVLDSSNKRLGMVDKTAKHIKAARPSPLR